MDQGIVSLRLRKARVDAPGALHHIIIRGIERKPIFKDKINYGNFTLTLQKYLVQKRFARSISGHQETIAHFQDLTVCSIRFRP
jgi:hypothetical protein